jgi:hypothetical protein
MTALNWKISLRRISVPVRLRIRFRLILNLLIFGTKKPGQYYLQNLLQKEAIMPIVFAGSTGWQSIILQIYQEMDEGMILSNRDAYFMKPGKSTPRFDRL